MSKNTSSSAFRKIDVDQYNEDNYKEDECGESQSPPVGPDEKEIINFLNQYPFIKNVLKDIILLKAKVLFVIFLNLIFFFTGKSIEALKTVLRNAPISSRNQMVKVNPDIAKKNVFSISAYCNIVFVGRSLEYCNASASLCQVSPDRGGG